MVNYIGNKPDFFLIQFRKHRQRNDFLRTFLAFRQFYRNII